MATLQHLSNRQIDEAVEAAAERQVPVTLTVRNERGWTSLHSRLLAVREGHLWLEAPRSDEGEVLHEFQPAEKTGVSFKLKHHKHIFTGIVAAVEEADLGEGGRCRVVQVCSPTKMHRMQRRAFFRAEVPANRVVRASFWLGGREAEPSGPAPDRPVWYGRVANLSAGGFQLRTTADAAGAVEIGETVGVRVIFGAGDETVYADAQFRHLQQEAGEVNMGFQFVGLAQSAEGRRALQLIGAKTSEYQRAAGGGHRGR